MEQRWTLSGVAEQRVLQAGMDRLLHALLARTPALALPATPRHAGGAPGVSQRSAALFNRLMSKRQLLKEAAQGDIAAAQCDLRYLRLEQLLALRAAALEPSAEVASCGDFGEALDRLLFEQVARRLLRARTQHPEPARVLRRLGLSMLLVLGAQDLLASGEPDGAPSSVPACWVLDLDAVSRSRNEPELAVFNSQDLWVVTCLKGDCPDYGSLAGGSPLALVNDRSEGGGRERVLQWHVAAVEPRAEDVGAALARARRRESRSETGAGQRPGQQLSRGRFVEATPAVSFREETESPEECRPLLGEAGVVASMVRRLEGQRPVARRWSAEPGRAAPAAAGPAGGEESWDCDCCEGPQATPRQGAAPSIVGPTSMKAWRSAAGPGPPRPQWPQSAGPGASALQEAYERLLCLWRERDLAQGGAPARGPGPGRQLSRQSWPWWGCSPLQGGDEQSALLVGGK